MGRVPLLGWILAVALGTAPLARAQSVEPAAPGLDRAAQAAFLRTAKVVRSRQLSTGVTSPYRLTLSDGTTTHDAAFQSVFERQTRADFGPRGVELNFVDSHHFNLAAFVLAGLVGLGDMMPVTVHRNWNGKDGTITWWIDDAFDERTRRQEKREAPNRLAWAHQMHRMRVFAALVGDTDRNLGNVLITPDWKLWMIDFTRAFRLNETLKYPRDLSLVDRRLLAGLRALDRDVVKKATAHCLTPFEVDALMTRRDALIAHFDALVQQKGAGAVLYGTEPRSSP
jgi:hypothetical protein